MTGAPPAGGNDHHWQGHDRKGQAGCQNAGAQAEKNHKGTQAEQRMNNGRDTREIDDGEVDGSRKPVVSGVFAQIDGGSDAQWHRGEQSHQHQPDRTEQRGKDAASGHAIGWIAEQKLHRDHRPPLHDQRHQNDNDRQHQQRTRFIIGMVTIPVKATLAAALPVMVPNSTLKTRSRLRFL